MGEKIGDFITFTLSSIIFVAIIATILGKSSQTIGVINAFANGLGTIISIIMAPIGGGNSINGAQNTYGIVGASSFFGALSRFGGNDINTIGQSSGQTGAY